MGDKRRNRKFAEFICQTFADHTNIADVAGGNGELSFLLLREHGKTPTLVEPRESRFPGWIQSEIQNVSMVESGGISIPHVRSRVDDIDVGRFDLIVAMHPDEATEPAMRAAIASNVDFAIVPCCPFPLEGKKRFGKQWIRHLASLAPDIRSTRLDISGPNTCLWRRRDDVVIEKSMTENREAIRQAVARMPRVRLAGDCTG